uniref:Uncharacterized protein n=1 Tax=Escherichia coli TaxID=562 RepID=A0A8F1LB38_ECOLX|nr:hypothetical protein IHCLGBEB_00166 [Escherichia coli]
MTDSVNKPRIRQARRRSSKKEGASVTVTLTKREEAMLQELCRVRRPGRTTHASVGVELPVSAAFPVCQPARDHGVGAGHRLPRHCHAPGQESGPYPPSGQDGRGHPDPAFWIGAQSECSLPHAVSRAVCIIEQSTAQRVSAGSRRRPPQSSPS